VIARAALMPMSLAVILEETPFPPQGAGKSFSYVYRFGVRMAMLMEYLSLMIPLEIGLME